MLWSCFLTSVMFQAFYCVLSWRQDFLIWPLIKILLSLSGYFVLFGIMIASFPCTDLFLDFIFKIKLKSTNANPTPRVNFRYRVYFIWHEMGDRPCHETPCQSNFWFLFSLFQFLLIKFNHIFVWFKINCGGAQRQSLHSWCEKWRSAHFWIKKTLEGDYTFCRKIWLY